MIGCAVTVLALCWAALAHAQPITEQPWSEAVLSVTDLDASARFFRQIGGYETHWRGPLHASEIAAWGLSETATGESLLLAAPGAERGRVRLVRFENAGRRAPMRPGSRAWDTGCYFSLMVRVKDIQSIYDDAIAMGWWTETPITDLQFGASKLKVVIFRGPDGVQVQGYERLEPPLPEAVGEFERMTRPFNIMQMVRDRDAAYAYFTEVLGFATFYNGPPYTAKAPTPMPLGIPVNLTTSVPYRAGIVYPVPGEFGRMEMIEITGLDGHDYSGQCEAPNLGILAVRFQVSDLDAALAIITGRGGSIHRGAQAAEIAGLGDVRLATLKTPDGALIQLYEH